MKSLRKIFTVVCIWAFALFLAGSVSWSARQGSQGSTSPQQPQNPSLDGQTTIRVPVNEVIVPVTVKDGAGRLVADLRKDEFRIFEDDVEQKISLFRADATPLSMVVLIDNDLKSKDAEQVEKSLRAIVAGMSTGDEAFVCRFDQYFHPGKGFTTDQDKLITELKRTQLDSESSAGASGAPLNNGPSINGHSATGDQPNISGTTRIIKGRSTKALDDAVYNASQLLKDRGRDRRKIIFLISDGINGQKANTYDYDAVRKELLRYSIAVYGLGVGSAYFDRRFERLAKYAHDSGGDVYYGLKSSAMEELYSYITEEARNQYTLAYYPAGTNHGAEYHSIEVRIKREGLTILTREGYYTSGVER